MFIERALWVIMLFVCIHFFQSLSIDFEQVIAASHAARLELANVVEGRLQII